MSDKPVAERLQVKGARQLAVLNAPLELDGAIGVTGARADAAEADVVLLFTADRTRFDAALAKIRKDAILWVAYPKLTSRLAADVSRRRLVGPKAETRRVKIGVSQPNTVSCHDLVHRLYPSMARTIDRCSGSANSSHPESSQGSQHDGAVRAPCFC